MLAAAQQGHAGILELLLDAGLSDTVFTSNKANRYRLSEAAAAAGSIPVLALLAKRHLLCWQDAAHAAAEAGHLSVCKWLCKHKRQAPAAHITTAAVKALHYQQIKICAFLISNLSRQDLQAAPYVKNVLSKAQQVAEGCGVPLKQLADYMCSVAMKAGNTAVADDVRVQYIVVSEGSCE
jgi:hypothetical protein